MKFPSIREIGESARATLLRFPFAMLAAILTTLMLWTAIDESGWFEAGHIMAAALGISACIAVELAGERSSSSYTRWIAGGITLLILIAYGLWLGEKPEDNLVEIYRFGLFALAAHLLVSVMGFIRKGSLSQFWEFNKTLFLRLLLSALFSAVLFGGLAVAMLAVDQLLLDGGVIQGKAYGKLFIIVAAIFNTLFFLSGVPSLKEMPERETIYPKGLKIFSANLLLPLVVLYLGILYIYALKILIDLEWPQGWVGWLVLSFSVLGVLALLLLWPLSRREGNDWIRRFTHWFYLAILPLIGLLFAAIFRRIGEYGITENRYFVVFLAIWLTGISLYFLLSKKKNIKVIPFSLFIGALLTSFGPWGAFAVSAESQASRFGGFLDKYGKLVNGVVDLSQGEDVDLEDRREMESILTFLKERDDLDLLKRYLPEDILLPGQQMERRRMVSRLFGLDRYAPVGKGSSNIVSSDNRFKGSIPFWIEPGDYELEDRSQVLIDVHGFDLVLPNLEYRMSVDYDDFASFKEFHYEGRNYTLMVRSYPPELRLVHEENEIFRFPLEEVLGNEVPEWEMRFSDDPSSDSVPAPDGRIPEPDQAPITTNEKRRSLQIDHEDRGVSLRLVINDMRGLHQPETDGQSDEGAILLERFNMTMLIGGLSEKQIVSDTTSDSR